MAFLAGILCQFGVGPIGEFVSGYDLAQRARVNQLGAGDAAQLRRRIEGVEFVASVAGGNGEVFQGEEKENELRP